MLQQTWLRLRGLPGADAPLVVANEEHRFMVAEQFAPGWRHAGGADARAGRRNTAPAIAVAALQAMAGGADPVLLVLPSDHVIADEPGFRAAVLAACPPPRPASW
jgi:mannose-1-phosphate guanylyltransferase/mannose-6-phosphate isomerase